MLIGVGEEAVASLSLPIRCPRCGHHDVAWAQGSGRGYGEVKLSLGSLLQLRSRIARASKAADQAADVAARFDAYLQIKLSRCPACGRRRRSWTAWAVMLSALIGLAVALIPFGIGAVSSESWLLGGLAWATVPFGLGLYWTLRRLLRGADVYVTFAAADP